MLLDWLTTLEKSGTVLFDLYEELEIDGSMPDALQTGTSRSTGRFPFPLLLMVSDFVYHIISLLSSLALCFTSSSFPLSAR